MNTELSIKLNNTLNGTSLKAIQDKNGNDINETYFPKSGGTLSGNVITKGSDNSYLRLTGGADNSALIDIRGSLLDTVSDTEKGSIIMVARNSENLVSHLRIYPNGELQHRTSTAGNENFTRTDLAGSAIIEKSLTHNGYVKYASGLTIQYGTFGITTTNNILNYPINFKSWHIITGSISTNPSKSVGFSRDSLSHTTIYTDATSGTLTWFAIGY